MRSLFLDYKRVLPAPGRAGYYFLIIGVAVVLQIVVYHHGLMNEVERYLEGQRVAGETQSISATGVQITGDIQTLRPEIRQANVVLRQLTMPWESLFKAVESSSNRHGKEIALLTIKPDAEKQQINIGGEAKNLNVLLDYIRLLSKQESLANVYLLSHQVQQQDREKPVGFSLVAEWKARS
jgi:Tfp pilus assembly protein PilN